MTDLKKISYLSFLFCVVFAGSITVASGQDRPRVVKTISSRPVYQPPRPIDSPKPSSTQAASTSQPTFRESRPALTTDIVLPPTQPLVKKTASVTALSGMASLAAGRMAYASNVSMAILRGIQARYGIPYLYGSTGPNRYDCSGFVWSVFHDAGIDFTRASVHTLWANGITVTGDERYKFGTLVFLNGLGHMGIVADENGFFHASSSKGITYSPFKGYWENRIVGFKRLGPEIPKTVAAIKTVE